jgi:hypothetical protein
MRSHRALVTATAFLISLCSASAHADGVMIVISNKYRVAVEGNTVQVCVIRTSTADKGWRETGLRLVREELTTGEFVTTGKDVYPSIPSLCDPLGSHQWCLCATDECVAPGRYRYAWTLLDHCGEVYVDAQVTEPLSPSCVRSHQVHLTDGTYSPWYGELDNYRACPVEAGCSLGGATPAVLGVDGLALLVALLLARRRRGR